MAKSLDTLMQEITEFTNSQFNQTKSSILVKLKEELSELEQAKESGKHSDEVNEFIDCFHLMLDYANRLELDEYRLREMVHTTLEANKSREWNEPNSDGVIKHKEDPRYNEPLTLDNVKSLMKEANIDREVIEDKICSAIKSIMYDATVYGNSRGIDFYGAVGLFRGLCKRIVEGRSDSSDNELMGVCSRAHHGIELTKELCQHALGYNLAELYIRLYGDPHAKTN